VVVEAQVQKPAQDQLFFQLSLAAISGTIQPRTMCFWGSVGDQHVKILLDSGSSNTFICPVIAAQCTNLQQLPASLQVQVANGEVITCSYIPSTS